MVEILAVTGCSILACLAVFQAALILGAPLGRFAWGGAHTVLPLGFRIGSFTSIMLYIVFAVLLLNKAGMINIVAEGIVRSGIWVTTVYFFIGVPLNAISRSKPERMVMTPVVSALAGIFLIVALN